MEIIRGDELDNPYICAKNISKRFVNKTKQETEVLKSVNFEVNEGEFVCIVGKSGCGKSTLMNILAGLDEDYDGEVFIGGDRVKCPQKDNGFVYQDPRLFPWLSVFGNVMFAMNGIPKEEKAIKTREVLNLVGLTNSENNYPHELSGGMAQRVNIARALVNNPKVLFLDEPFSALDSFTRMQMQNELLTIRNKRKCTMLMVTHDIEEAVYLADKIIVLSDKPAIIKDIVEIDLEYPRNRASSDFLNIRTRINDYFY